MYICPCCHSLPSEDSITPFAIARESQEENGKGYHSKDVMRNFPHRLRWFYSSCMQTLQYLYKCTCRERRIGGGQEAGAKPWPHAKSICWYVHNVCCTNTYCWRRSWHPTHLHNYCKVYIGLELSNMMYLLYLDFDVYGLEDYSIHMSICWDFTSWVLSIHAYFTLVRSHWIFQSHRASVLCRLDICIFQCAVNMNICTV